MECMDHEDYSPTVRDHAQTPRNNGALEEFSGNARITGPCGDTMEFWILVESNKVIRATFVTDGCGPSLACGSMATCLATNRTLEEVVRLKQKDVLEALGGLPGESAHCALLAVNTLRAACEDFLRRSSRESGNPLRKEEKMRDSDGGMEDPEFPRRPGESDEEYEGRLQLRSRLGRIRHKVIVLSGKGGVGKSTVAVNLAAALAMSGKRVGLLDVDIHGPSVPILLGLENQRIRGNEEGIFPVEARGIQVMSIGFLLESPDDAVIWRGPRKMAVIKQFLKDVAWGDLDYLIIDSPPGTGDEPLSVCQLIGAPDGAVIVTTPQRVAAADVRKSITFCRQLSLPVIGVVENMNGFVCPQCGASTPILNSGGGKKMAEEMDVPFLGSIPMDPAIAESGDAGRAFVETSPESPASSVIHRILKPILALDFEDRPLAGR